MSNCVRHDARARERAHRRSRVRWASWRSRGMAACRACRTGGALGFVGAELRLTVRPLALAVFLALASGFLSGCEPRRKASALVELRTEVRDSGRFRILTLSHTLQEIATGHVVAQTLEPDLRVGDQKNAWFGIVADVASLGHGRFAVLDRMEDQIMVFDSLGRLTRRLGRSGDGPGEFRDPWAMTRVGDKLVVWQWKLTGTLTVLDTTGHVVATAGADVPGDWLEPRLRYPLHFVHEFLHGPEDITRRLQPDGDSGFVLHLQMNEKEHIDPNSPIDFPAPPAYLIRYDQTAAIRDTVATLVGPPTLLWERVRADEDLVITYYQPLFAARPAWAVGDGWLATSHGDSTGVVVRGESGDTVLFVRWPERRSAISERDKIEAGRWLMALAVVSFPGSRKIWQSKSRRERKRDIESYARNDLPFADSVPMITAMYSTGQCLFLFGYNPRDWVDATSATFVALDIARGAVEGVFRIPWQTTVPPLEMNRRGGAIREFDPNFVYTVTRDGNGVFMVQRYALPPLPCASV